jgi:2-methylisocitrate lyase-like PEP mutase family enzyme
MLRGDAKLVVRGCNVGQARLVRRVGWLGSCNYLGKWAMTDEIDVLQKSLSLKSRITQDGVVVAPGVYDALTASLAASAGFEALYLSGAAIAYTRLGRPDIGLMSSTEVADTLAHLSERVETPIIVDADTGYGNALNVERTVRLFERAGAAAIQLEDQTFPKRCGHLEGKGIVAMHEMVGKIHAAVDARRRTQTLIIARTDAIAGEGFESAIQRAECYFGRGG